MMLSQSNGHAHMPDYHATLPSHSDHVDGVIPNTGHAHSASSPVMLNSFASVQFTRQQILRNVMQTCSQVQEHPSMESKVNGLTVLIGQMAQLLLLEQNGGDGSPLSWVTFSSDGTGNGDGAALVSSDRHVTRPSAIKLFKCPACPVNKPPLTEKGFYKHVLAWRGKSRNGKRKPACPGIRSRLVFGIDEQEVISSTLRLLNPGANAAHGGGTGNHVNVADYLSTVCRPR